MKPELMAAAKKFLVAKYRDENGVNRDPTTEQLTEWALLKWSAARGQRSDSTSSGSKAPGGVR